ncbi:MAG: iron transporter [Eubacteriales bacterium]|nr:iron transporter [Eubacteriales bacterium]
MKSNKLLMSLVALAMGFSLVMPYVVHGEDAEKEEPKTEEKSEEAEAAEGEDAAGFEEVSIDEWDLKDPDGNDTLHLGMVYFQPVDMEPAGNSIAKEDADCHMEADIHAMKGNTLGYADGDFVPYLKVKLFVTQGDKTEEVAFMPMNASDGPHYGANYKFFNGVGKYDLRLEIEAPGNDYLLHVDKETGVTGRFWTEPLTVEVKDFEWDGREW